MVVDYGSPTRKTKQYCKGKHNYMTSYTSSSNCIRYTNHTHTHTCARASKRTNTHTGKLSIRSLVEVSLTINPSNASVFPGNTGTPQVFTFLNWVPQKQFYDCCLVLSLSPQLADLVGQAWSGWVGFGWVCTMALVHW